MWQGKIVPVIASTTKTTANKGGKKKNVQLPSDCDMFLLFSFSFTHLVKQGRRLPEGQITNDDEMATLLDIYEECSTSRVFEKRLYLYVPLCIDSRFSYLAFIRKWHLSNWY